MTGTLQAAGASVLRIWRRPARSPGVPALFRLMAWRGTSRRTVTSQA